MLDQIALASALVFVLAGTVKGLIGIGLPTVSVGIMSQFLPPHFAIAVVVFPMLVSNAWQVYRSGAGLQTFRKYRVLITLLVVSLWLTTFFTARAAPEVLLAVIGLSVSVFAATNLARPLPPLPPAYERPAQVITGLTAGVLGGLSSIWSPPIVSYLILTRADREEFVRAAGFFIFIGSIPLAIGFWQTGMLDGQVARLSLLMILPTLLGFSLGEALRRRMDPDRFRRVVLWIFLIMGINLLRRAFF